APQGIGIAQALGGTVLYGTGRSGHGASWRLPGDGRNAWAQSHRRKTKSRGAPLTLDQVINIVVMITLFEMMITVGLRVTLADLFGVAKNWRLVGQGLLANYVAVPAAAVGLLLLFGAAPMVCAGFLILAVCPGAPFGPPCTALAKGNVTAAVGLMVLLAGSSALLAPVLLSLLLPWIAGGEPLHVDAGKIVTTLLLTQLLPLCLGLGTRYRWPKLADK